MHSLKIAISLLTLSLNCAWVQAQISQNSEAAPLPGSIDHPMKIGGAPLPGTVEDKKTNEVKVSISKFVPLELVGHRIIAPAVLKTSVNSHTAYVGNPIDAVLNGDLVIAGRKIAQKGCLIKGHISSVTSPRTFSQAIVSADRRYNSRAAVQIQFDEIIDPISGNFPISGIFSQQEAVFAAGTPQRREISVRENGVITRGEAALSPEKKNVYNATRLLTVAPFPASVLVNVAGPSLAMGAGAAIDPAFAYVKPVEPTVKHKRMKAFTYAFVTNLPGAFYVQSVVEKGGDIELREGDELALDICLKGDAGENKSIYTTQPYTVTGIKGILLPSPATVGYKPSSSIGALNSDGTTLSPNKSSNDFVSNQRMILPDNGGYRLLPVVQASNQPSI